MYENVRQMNRRTARNNLPLALALTVGFVAVAALVALVWWACRYQVDYRAFVADLSNSTTYAYDHNSLTVTMEGEQYPIDRANIHRIYSRISNAGPGRPGRAPTNAPDAVLDYGDGSRMELWSVPLDYSNTGRKIGLFIRYVDREGESYSYDSDKLELLLLPIERWDNAS